VNPTSGGESRDAEVPTWQPIAEPCPRCGAVETCFRAGRALACRFETTGEIRIHVGYPPTSATYALTGVDETSPDFPGCISEYTADISRRLSWES
jgi:hypothetical protein